MIHPDDRQPTGQEDEPDAQAREDAIPPRKPSKTGHEHEWRREPDRPNDGFDHLVLPADCQAMVPLTTGSTPNHMMHTSCISGEEPIPATSTTTVVTR